MKILLVPGWAMTPVCWRMLQAQLGNQFEYVTTAWNDMKSPDDIPGVVGKLVQREGTGHLLCGWSMGGMACLEYLSENPGAVHGLVLLSTCASFIRRPGHGTGWDRKVLERTLKRLDTDRQGMMSDFIGTISSCGKDIKAVREEIHASVDHAVSTEILRIGLEYLLLRDLREAVKKIKVPALIIHGADDRTVPPGSAELLRSLLGGRTSLVFFDQAGHVPLVSCPEDCANLIRKFIADL